MKYIQTTAKKIGSIFVSGLFTILPLTITIILIHTSIRFILKWLEPLRALIAPTILSSIPYAEVFLMLLLILSVGIVYRLVILRSLIHAIDALFGRIPLIRPIYMGVKQLINAFGSQDEISFKKVVLIQFPRKGVYSIGFVTSKLPSHIAPEKNKTFLNIYIPTTPNPTTGYFVVASESEITVVDLKRQEAMALIMSGGIIQPKRFH